MSKCADPTTLHKARLSDVPRVGLMAGNAFGRPSRLWRLVVPAMLIGSLIAWVRGDLYISVDRHTSVIVQERHSWRALLRWIRVAVSLAATLLGILAIVVAATWALSGDLLTALNVAQSVNMVGLVSLLVILALGLPIVLKGSEAGRHRRRPAGGFWEIGNLATTHTKGVHAVPAVGSLIVDLVPVGGRLVVVPRTEQVRRLYLALGFVPLPDEHWVLTRLADGNRGRARGFN